MDVEGQTRSGEHGSQGAGIETRAIEPEPKFHRASAPSTSVRLSHHPELERIFVVNIALWRMRTLSMRDARANDDFNFHFRTAPRWAGKCRRCILIRVQGNYLLLEVGFI